MNKAVWLYKDICSNFFSKRMLIFCVFQFTVMHYYIYPVKHFSILADYPATPWILPFLGQNTYFLFVYGISVVYFYSNVPFMQRNQLYVLVRQKRLYWTVYKLIGIWLSAFLLSVVEFLLSILPLFSRIEWVAQWGKLYYSLALTDATIEYGINLYFSYDLINSNTVMGTMLTMIFLLFLVTGMVGTVMFSLSVCLNRTAAVLVGTVLAVFTVVLENMYRYCEWLVFFSPFSWTNLLLLYQRTRKMAPSVHMAILMIIIVGTVFTILALKRMLIIDLHWSDEE